MSGAHYEIIRRLVRSDSLPPIKELRTRLYAAWSPHVSSEQEGEVKLFPMRVINMGAGLTISHYQGLGMHLPAPIVTIAYDLELARDTVRNDWAHRIRPHAEVDYTNATTLSLRRSNKGSWCPSFGNSRQERVAVR